MKITPEEFKRRWDSDARGGGITLFDVAQCARDWGLCQHPFEMPIERVLYRVLCYAKTDDREAHKPD